MSHKVWIIVATAAKRDESSVRKCIHECCQELMLREADDYVFVPCPRSDLLTAKLAEARSTQVSLLLIAEPSLSHRDEIHSIITTEAKRDPKSVVVLNLNNYRLSKSINSNQVIRDLDAEFGKLSEYIRQFLKEAVERGLDDYNHFALKLEEYKARYLSPLLVAQNSARGKESAATAKSQQGDGFEVPTAEFVASEWSALAGLIVDKAAAILERAVPAKSADAARNASLLSVAHALLHLWVEVRLYGLRAWSNHQVYHRATQALLGRRTREPLKRFPPGFDIDPGERLHVMSTVKQYSKDYQAKLRSFDRALRRQGVPRDLRFGHKIGDAEQYRMWSVLFGPDNVSSAYEPGWDTHAAGARRELAYRSRCALQHEYWQRKTRWPSAFILTVYRLVAGFGERPGRAGGFFVGGIVVFAALQWLDDVGSACSRTPGRFSSVLALVKFYASAIEYYVEVSVSSITNLGSVSSPCGLGHGALLSAESIFGYFLLAILTTLFVQSLLDR